MGAHNLDVPITRQFDPSNVTSYFLIVPSNTKRLFKKRELFLIAAFIQKRDSLYPKIGEKQLNHTDRFVHIPFRAG